MRLMARLSNGLDWAAFVLIDSPAWRRVRRAHAIFVIDDGRVVESGSHEQLLRSDGLYTRLYDLQFGKEEEGQPATAAV